MAKTVIYFSQFWSLESPRLRCWQVRFLVRTFWLICRGLHGSVVKKPPAMQKMQEMQVRSLGQEDPLQEEMATNSSVLACKNSMGRGAWWAAVHGVSKSRTPLSTQAPSPYVLTWWQLSHLIMSDSLQPHSMEFSRQEHWSGLPFPSPGDLPDPGMDPGSPALRADALLSEPLGNPSRGRRCYISLWSLL